MANIPYGKITLAICKPGKDPLMVLAPSLPGNSLAVSMDASARELSKMGMKMERLTWVDATGKLFWDMAPEKELENWLFTEGPDALSHLSVLVATNAARGNVKFVVLCKLNSILAKSGPVRTLEFIKYLVEKLRSLGIGFMVIAEEDAQVKRLERSLGRTFDKKIAI